MDKMKRHSDTLQQAIVRAEREGENPVFVMALLAKKHAVYKGRYDQQRQGA